MRRFNITERIRARAAADSALGREVADARLHGSRISLEWVWLIWLGWLFGPLFFGQTKYFPYWLWPTVLSIPVFLGLYLRAYLSSRRHVVWYALGITALGLAVLPFNAYAGTYLIYACACAAEWGNPRRAFTLILGFMAALGVEWLGFGIPWQYLANFWVLCLVIGGMGIYGSIQRQRRADLRLSQDEVRRLAASAERERIGRDLHDLLGHTLSMVALKSELAGRLVERDPAAAGREMAEVAKISREALSQVRSAVRGIRAAALASELASARLLLETAGVQMDYWSDGNDLPPAVETCLALVLREAVTNIQRHARANRVEVTVIVGAERVVMRIRDDGRGGVNARGNGLTGMRERIAEHGGELWIESPRGKGTGIEVRLPLPPQPAHHGRVQTQGAADNVVPLPRPVAGNGA
ncbi:MAG TPA: sensor histidine kinase [Rhodanobacteraceae bacterium]